MKSKSIMSRSAFTKRRKVIIYMILMILILGVVAGFADPFITDNTIHKAQFGETIVMEKAPPAEGTPEDYDLISNLQYAAYTLHHATFFRAVTSGKTVADIGFTTYTQNVNNIRVSNGNGIVFAETISSSSLKSVAEQKYADNGIIIFRRSKSINGNSATFENTASIMSYENYAANYGTVPDQLSKYIINENTILSVKDENAVTQPAANAASGKAADSESDGTGFDFYVPQNLVADADGNYKFTLTLDATESSLYYRNEVRTLAGADQNPKFYAVTLTITIDSNWNPISVRTVENYDIAIPVLGAMNCTGTLTEYFTQINDPDGEIPERDFFQPYVDKAKSDPNYVPPEIDTSGPSSPADYLASAFAEYISGEKDLELTVDMSAEGISAYGLTLSLNLETMAANVMLGDLYVRYADGKVNLKLNDINGYMSVEDFNALMQNEQVKDLMSDFGSIDIDFMSIFGGDMLGTVFSNCEMTSEDGVTRIHMPFTLDLSALGIGADSAYVDASIYIEDEGLKLKSITGKITVLGKTIEIEAMPMPYSPVFPSTAGAVDLSGVIDLVPDLIATASQNTYGISGSVTAMGQSFDVTAYIDRENGLKADMVISAMGLDVSVKYADGTVYVALGNIDARGTLEELPVLMNALLDVTDFGNYITLIKKLMPQTVNEFISMVKSLEVTDSTLTLGLNVLTAPVTIGLKHEDGALSGLTFDMSFNLLNISLEAAADLAIYTPETREIILPSGDDYITFTQLAQLISDIAPYLDETANFDVTLNGAVTVGIKEYSVNGNLAIDRLAETDGATLSASGALNMLGQTVGLIYADGTTYVDLAGIKTKLASADTEKLQTPILRIFNMFADLDGLDLSAKTGDAVSMIKSLLIDNDGVITITLLIDGNELYITLDPVSGKATAFGYINDVKIDISMAISISETAHGITAPNDADSYIDASVLDVTINSVADILDSKSLSANAYLTYGENVYAARIQTTFANGLMLRLTSSEYDLDVTVVGTKAYITFGEIKLYGELSDINAALEASAPVIPSDVLAAINDVTSMLDNMPEIEYMVDTALTSLVRLSVEDDAVVATISYNGIIAEINLALSLGRLSVNIQSESLTAQLELIEISPAQVEITEPDATEYAKASDVIAAASPVIPLAAEQCLNIAVNAEMSGVKIIGNVYIDFGDGALKNMQVEAKFNVGDLPITAIMKNAVLYVSIGNNIKFSLPLTEADIMNVLDKLDYAIAGLKDKIVSIIDCFKSLNANDIIKSVSLAPVDNGFAATVDLNDSGLEIAAAISMYVNNGTFSGIDMDLQLFGINLVMSMNPTVNGNVISKLDGTAKYGDISLALGLEITGAEARSISAIQNSVPLADLAELIKPMLDLMSDASNMKSAVIDLGAFALTCDNMQTYIGGTLALSLDETEGIAIDLTLTLFYGTDYAQDVNIKFVGNVVYIQSGNIMLSFDTNSDLQRLYNVIEGYLPEYINDEIAKLFGLKSGASIFSDVTQLIERMAEIAEAESMDEVIDLLFSPLSGLSGNSAIKTITDMINLFERDGNVTVAVTVMGFTFNMTPIINNEKLVSVEVDTTVSMLDNLYIKAIVTSYALSEAELKITAPDNAADYVSIVEFVEAINNAVNTLTATDEDGNITFELKTFEYDYEIFAIETTEDEDGNTVNVKDEAGRDKPLTDAYGNKVIDTKIDVTNKQGESAIKVKFIKTETVNENGEIETSYKLNLEAHLVIAVNTLTHSSPITLDLYAINNEQYESGIAFIDYMESNGNGERISIDYASVMEIVAAVMDIMSVDDDTMDLLLGDYRVEVDKTVFESMAIAGLDSVRDMLNGLADAVQSVTLAKENLLNAWDLIRYAGNVDTLRDRLENIEEYLGNAIEHFNNAVAAFGGNGGTVEPDGDNDGDENEITQLNGKLYQDIVTGVTLKKDDTHVWATIENEITTGTSGIASVVVTQNNNRLDSVTVEGLDVNTAKLNKFTTLFTAGEQIDISLPSNYNSNTSNATYSDFANIKHLLFDVMNTANMLEFEIGGGANDKINLNVLGIIKVDIAYSAKIKIIDQGEGANPRYKTAADIQLDIPGYSTGLGAAKVFGLAKCTTRVFFYDDVIYMHGVDSWSASANFLGKETYNVNYIDAVFTIDDFFNTIADEQNGIDTLFNEFVFRLLPLLKSFLGMDIHDKIIDAVKNPPEAAASLNTIAQIFKGYTYSNGEHSLTVGLKELALNGSLRDASIKITGANDSDDNLLDNYISNLYLETTFGTAAMDLATIKLYATLTNVSTPIQYYTDSNYTIKSPNNTVTDYGRNELESTRLSSTVIDGVKYSLDGKPCTDEASPKSIIDTLLAIAEKDSKGNVIGVTNRPNGTQWQRIWA